MIGALPSNLHEDPSERSERHDMDSILNGVHQAVSWVLAPQDFPYALLGKAASFFAVQRHHS